MMCHLARLIRSSHLAAFLQQWQAICLVGVKIHGMLGSRDDGLVAVVETVVYTGFLLDDGIKPAIVNPEGD